MTLNSHVVVITGASSGLGEKCFQLFAEQGASVVLLARRRERLEQLIEEWKKKGADPKRFLALECDVTRPEELQRAHQKTLEVFGRVDGLIANAGFGVEGDFKDLARSDLERQWKTNVWGVVDSVRVYLPSLIASKGRLVLIGSVSGYLSFQGTGAYSMSKYAIRALAESLYVELGKSEVSVTLVSPGFIATEIRKVDNQGAYRETRRDPVPLWLMESAEGAAQKVVKAYWKRKREIIFPLHAKFAMLFSGGLRGILYLLLRWLLARSRNSQ